MLNSTGCEVHTFDCTVDGHSVHKGRHFFHKTCLGRPGTPTNLTYTNFPWPNAMAQSYPADPI